MKAIITPSELFLLPYEETTSYLSGTVSGPTDLLPLLTPLPFPHWNIIEPGILDAESYLDCITRAVKTAVSKGYRVAALGGEHTVSFGILAGFVEAGIRPSVIQLDAHADLRHEYDETPWSHACVMRRVAEILHLSVLGIGIRSLSREEARYARAADQPIIYAHQIRHDTHALSRALSKLGRTIYLTVDVDCLDPSVVPGTGTPEPGGLKWHELLRIIDLLVEGRRLVGFDVVEYCPPAERDTSRQAVAELVRRLWGHFSSD